MPRKPKPKPINLAPTARKPTDCADTWGADEGRFFSESSFSVAPAEPSHKSCIVRHMVKTFALELWEGLCAIIGGLIGLGLFIGLPVGIVWYFFGKEGIGILILVVGIASLAFSIMTTIIRLYRKAHKECG